MPTYTPVVIEKLDFDVQECSECHRLVVYTYDHDKGHTPPTP